MRRTISLAAALLPFAAPPAMAQESPQPAPTAAPAAPAEDGEDAGLRAYIRTLRPRAIAEGIRPATFDSVLSTLSFVPRVVALDRGQPGNVGSATPVAYATPARTPFAPYRRAHVEPVRIALGKRKLQSLSAPLAQIQASTGVAGSIMLGIYGQETGYGGVTGSFDLLRALGSLAYEGRRRALFSGEYLATLKLLDRGIPREQLKGSWAGATGYPQFLPSTYLRLGRDGDGDGKVDIWRNEPDALASIANYLLDAGWKPNTVWGVAATVPASLDRNSVRPLATAPTCGRVTARLSRWKTVAEWRQLGVVPTGARAPADGELTALIEPDGPGGTAYLLTTNYRAILGYNCSNHYALSVTLLADAVAQ